CVVFFFFFQAEDGIRDRNVTGVQTCAPISAVSMLIGVPLGLLAGYFRGGVEAVIMRIADVFMAFPDMMLILVLVSVVGKSVVAKIGRASCRGRVERRGVGGPTREGRHGETR